jgi:Fur family iron response transcriptional regulator|tara:strand:+ start:817 stop:1236 length:420 start_codon:yes stop_codon:yes gene_type:complete
MINLNNFIEKLRKSGLRPTKQRIKICEILFSSDETFHFTINDITKIIEEKISEKISLATIYNTVHAFKKKGYLKEISINNEKNYFDTNISDHHHFFDTKKNELIDIDSNKIELKSMPNPPKGKSIKNINIVINIENDSH